MTDGLITENVLLIGLLIICLVSGSDFYVKQKCKQ